MIKDKQGNILADLRNTSIISKQYPIVFNSSGNVLSDYIIYGNTNGVGDYNSTSQKYIIPVTIHSKNLFNANNATLTTSYPDNINGQFTDQLDYCHSLILPFSQGVYTFSLNCPTNEEPRNRNKNRIACYSSYPQVGDNCLTWTENYIRDEDRFSIPFCAPAGTAYISIFLWASNTYTNAYIADVIANSELMIEPGNEFTSYIAYNTNTINLSLDSALTANQNISKKDTNTQISTYKGTNLLTIGTTVWPSNVLIKGNINYAESSYFNMHRVRFYNQDGSQLLYTEYVPDGKNAHGWALTPSKASTNQYTYNFVGWNIATGQIAATANVLNNIITDKDVYAAFQQVERTFTVQFFYDENTSTPLQTVYNVPYGGTAIYTGATPTSSQVGYIFSGWSPSNTNITADTSCYAQFVDEDMYESISNTWSEIIANVSNGTYSTKYHIGDTKKIDLGTEGEVIMQIVGINADDLADNSGKAPITWISKQLLKTAHRMNPQKQSGTSGTGALGGWEACEMRSYLINTIKPLLPSEVRNALKTVKKYSKIYNTSGTAVNNVVSNDDIWIPSAYEVNFTGHEASGITYSTAFPDNASRIKHKVGGSVVGWWLRSANDTSSFRNVGNKGSYYGNYAYYSYGVAVGFCT